MRAKAVFLFVSMIAGMLASQHALADRQMSAREAAAHQVRQYKSLPAHEREKLDQQQQETYTMLRNSGLYRFSATDPAQLAKLGITYNPETTRILTQRELAEITAENGTTVVFKRDLGIRPGTVLVYADSARLVVDAFASKGSIVLKTTSPASFDIVFSGPQFKAGANAGGAR